MGALALNEIYDEHDEEIYSYIYGYWNENDIWKLEDRAFEEAGIETGGQKGILADFSSFKSGELKAEMKFYLLHALKEKELISCSRKYFVIGKSLSVFSGL